MRRLQFDEPAVLVEIGLEGTHAIRAIGAVQRRQPTGDQHLGAIVAGSVPRLPGEIAGDPLHAGHLLLGIDHSHAREGRGVSVGRNNGRAGADVIEMDVADELRLGEQILRRPVAWRLVGGACGQLEAHAAIKQDDVARAGHWSIGFRFVASPRHQSHCGAPSARQVTFRRAMDEEIRDHWLGPSAVLSSPPKPEGAGFLDCPFSFSREHGTSQSRASAGIGAMPASGRDAAAQRLILIDHDRSEPNQAMLPWLRCGALVSWRVPCRSKQIEQTRLKPWNIGRIIGAKPPLKPKHIWSMRALLVLTGNCATSQCSTSRWTASCEAAISCG